LCGNWRRDFAEEYESQRFPRGDGLGQNGAVVSYGLVDAGDNEGLPGGTEKRSDGSAGTLSIGHDEEKGVLNHRSRWVEA